MRSLAPFPELESQRAIADPRRQNLTVKRFNAEVPRAGPDLPFEAWNRTLVARLREMIPDVTATRRGKTVTLRYRDHTATIEDRHPTWVVHFAANAAGLAIDRFDDFTARTVAKSLAGHFEDRWSKAD